MESTDKFYIGWTDAQLSTEATLRLLEVPPNASRNDLIHALLADNNWRVGKDYGTPRRRDEVFIGLREDTNTYEEFRVTKVAVKYIYCRSNTYSSDGMWRFEKNDVTLTVRRY